MKLSVILLLILIALGVVYYFNFDSVNSFVRSISKLPVQNDLIRAVNINDSNFIYYNDFEDGFSFKYPIGYYVVEENNSEPLVGLIHFGNYGDIEYFAFQQYSEDAKTRFSKEISNEVPVETTVQGRKGYFTQSFTGTAILRNFYFTCSNKNYVISTRIPSSFPGDSDLYYYFIKNFNCNLK